MERCGGCTQPSQPRHPQSIAANVVVNVNTAIVGKKITRTAVISHPFCNFFSWTDCFFMTADTETDWLARQLRVSYNKTQVMEFCIQRNYPWKVPTTMRKTEQNLWPEDKTRQVEVVMKGKMFNRLNQVSSWRFTAVGHDKRFLHNMWFS